MSRKPTKLDVNAPRDPLAESPFGALAALKPDLPVAPPVPPAPKAEIIDDTPPPWRVAKTRKGGWPVAFEKRAAGKLVTVIQNVSGDGDALLKVLRKHCATGGVYREGAIELQGDHRVKVAAWLEKARR